MFVTFIFSTNGDTHFGKIVYNNNQKINYDIVKNDALYILNIIDKINGFDYLTYNEFSIGILGISENLEISDINEAKNFRIYIDKSNIIYNYYFNNKLIKIINTYETESETELDNDTESNQETDTESEQELDNDTESNQDNEPASDLYNEPDSVLDNEPASDLYNEPDSVLDNEPDSDLD